MAAAATPAMAEESDAALMRRVASGDHAAFSTLVSRHSGRFYAYAWRMTGHRGMAEDGVQDAFLKVWKNPHGFDPDKNIRFTTWFYRVLGNAIIDARRRSREQSDEPALERAISSAALPDEEFEQGRRQQAVQAAINALPDRQREALTLCFYEGLSNADAADILDVKVKALESLLMRAKKTLKDQLGKSGWLENGGFRDD